jgi:hypothetical protein
LLRASLLTLSLTALSLGVVFGGKSPRVRRAAFAAGRRLAGEHAHFTEIVSADHFQRGNLHTHSTISDGHAPVEAMVGWYRTHGYQFVAMTEHNRQIPPMQLAVFAAPGFVVIPGEEVTNGWGTSPLHVNSLCARGGIGGWGTFETASEGLSETLGGIRNEGGIPVVNHPNFHWTLTADDIAAGASGRYLLEIWSGHPAVNPAGDALHPSAEAIWDDLLARGADAIPVAVDDAHSLPDDPAGGAAIPGQGWVETFGDETSTGAICAALAAGHLYASSGPALLRIDVRADTFTVATTDPDARVAFVGERGEILAEVRASDVSPKRDAPDEREITYRLQGGETLVRARIVNAAGERAWTAAYRVVG